MKTGETLEIDTYTSPEMQRIRHTRLNRLCLPLLEPNKLKRREGNHPKGRQDSGLPSPRESLEDRVLSDDTAKPALNPLNESHERARILDRALLLISCVPRVYPCLLGAREPEPFAVVVLLGALLEIDERGGVLGVCECLAEGDGDVVAGERRNGEADVGFEGLHNGVGHFVECEGDVCYNAQETEASCCGLEMGWVGDGAVLSVGVDVLNCSDIVVDGFMAATGTVTDGAIDASKRDSGSG